MTTDSKGKSRLLARAESMRQAIVESPLPKEWERVDLDHMADAAVMLWDQANDLAHKEPESRDELSEAISLIFEPLLHWAGRFDLAYLIAKQRSSIERKHQGFRKPVWDSLFCQFMSLCYQGRFQDDAPDSRQKTFQIACSAYEALIPYLECLDVKHMAHIAYGWHLMGLSGVANQIVEQQGPTVAKDCFSDLNAPLFWRQAHITSHWIDYLERPH